jgi:hypothetical protein
MEKREELSDRDSRAATEAVLRWLSEGNAFELGEWFSVLVNLPDSGPAEVRFDPATWGNDDGVLEVHQRANVPDIGTIAEQVLEDLSPDPREAMEYLDAVGTIGAADMSEDDLIELVIHFALMVIAKSQPD